jgi:hypothetical protein
LKVLRNILPDSWASVYTAFQLGRKQRIIPNTGIDPSGNKILKTRSLGPVTESKNMNSSMSGASLSRMASTQVTSSSAATVANAATQAKGSCAIYVTTKDAYTLTDGPTIFLANDVQKVAKFCIQQANIPASIMKDIMEKIEFNNTLNERIAQIESDLAFEEEKITNKLCGASGASKSMERKNKNKSKIASDMIDKTDDANIVKMRDTLEDLKKMVKSATLNDVFIPNKLAHLAVWAEHVTNTNTNTNTKSAFTSNIDEVTISSIMLLKDVEDSWKVLLLLGIGVFTEHKSIAYTEIMKKLADKQLLYLIIADTDYIYGTNYQFCHGYLSKDLNMTQEKIIQALGRIGRNNIQQEYSARFRDDAQIKTLFTSFKSEDKPEVLNMNILFNTANVKWNGSEYVEVVEEVVDEK